MGEGAGVLGRQLNTTLESSGYEPWQFPPRGCALGASGHGRMSDYATTSSRPSARESTPSSWSSGGRACGETARGSPGIAEHPSAGVNRPLSPAIDRVPGTEQRPRAAGGLIAVFSETQQACRQLAYWRRLTTGDWSSRSTLASPSRPPGGAASTSQGHPRTIFRRALEHDNLVLAQVTAREISRGQPAAPFVRYQRKSCRSATSDFTSIGRYESGGRARYLSRRARRQLGAMRPNGPGDREG
jgi:hypothetical protein